MTIMNQVPGTAGAPGAGPEAEEGLPAARLRAAVSRMARWLRPTEAAGSLTATEVDMLMVAEKRGPARMSAFANFCGLNPTMLSRMVPRLEEMGLLARLSDPADKRACLIVATEQGRALLARVRSERNDLLSSLLDELSPAEVAAVLQATPVLERLAERLRDQSGQDQGSRR